MNKIETKQEALNWLWDRVDDGELFTWNDVDKKKLSKKAQMIIAQAHEKGNDLTELIAKIHSDVCEVEEMLCEIENDLAEKGEVEVR